MSALRESFTAVLALGETWEGRAETEPYECAWASEGIFFLRALAVEGDPGGASAAVEISPDGVHWVAEGTTVALPHTVECTTFAKIAHFGGFVRLVAELPPGVACQLVVSLALKG